MNDSQRRRHRRGEDPYVAPSRLASLLLGCLLTVSALVVGVPGGQRAWAGPPTGAPRVPPASGTSLTGGALADIQVTTDVSPKTSKIGDVIELVVEVNAPPGFTANLPIGLRLEPFEIVAVREEPATIPSGRNSRRFVVEVQHFSAADTTIPGFALTVVTPQGEVSTLDVPATPVMVEALLANETDPAPKPDDPAISLPYPNTWAETLIYASLVALIVGLIASYVFALLRRRATVPPPPRVVPPHERALDEIRRIETEIDERFDRDEIVDLYVEMSAVARTYLDGRFKIPAQEWTTDEIREALRGRESDIYPLRAGEIMHFFEEGDLIKFARLRPTREEPREALAILRSIVERTIPQLGAEQDPQGGKPPPSSFASREDPQAVASAGLGATQRQGADDARPSAAPANGSDDREQGGAA